jgi:hypothetical protein
MPLRVRCTTILTSASCLVGLTLAPCDAIADDLTIETTEQESWPAAVAKLQTDRNSEGTTLHVVVKDDRGSRLACGTYAIAIDGPGAEAFGSGGCNSETNATSVRLLHRTELFSHDDRVPRPRAPRILVQRVQVGAAAGGARQTGGSVISCTAEVRPFVDDLESGARVALTPGRYELRVKNPDVEVKSMSDGWRLVGHAATSADVGYDVYDGKRNEVVFHDRVKMACEGDVGVSADATPVRGSESAPQPWNPVTVDTRASRDADSVTPANASGDWDGRAWTVSVFAGPAYMRPSGQTFTSGSTSVDASVFGLGNVTAMAVGLSVTYERTGIYSSLGGHVTYVGVNDWSLFEYGVMSTIAASLHFGDVSAYLGPHVALGSYELTGVAGASWATPAAFSLGAATGVRVHFRDDGGKAWVLGGEIVAPVVGAEPWLFVASIGWGGAI